MAQIMQLVTTSLQSENLVLVLNVYKQLGIQLLSMQLYISVVLSLKQLWLRKTVTLNRHDNYAYPCRAGGIGPAAPVLAGPVFSQGKSKIPFLQKASNKQSASVILGLIILSYNRQKRHIMRCKIIGRPRISFIVMLQGTLLCKS